MRGRFRAQPLALALVLAGCGGSAGMLPTLAPTSEAEMPESDTPLAVVAEVVVAQARDRELVTRSLAELHSQPRGSGLSLVFSYDERLAGNPIHCTGHALVAPVVDGWWLTTMNRVCGPLGGPDLPIGPAISEGVDADGTSTLALFGEVYEPAVAEIQADFSDGRTLSVFPAGGAYQIVLTQDVSALTLRAIDGQGGLLYQDAAPPLPGGGIQPGPPPEEIRILFEDSR